jgi:CheY-like chemotaxis protein
LLVDDCDETRQMYAEVLTASFEVAQASTAREALAKASELLPSAIVMDLVLPDMDGKDAILRLRRDARTGQIPVVVLSGAVEPAGKTPPWDGFLAKPFPPDALRAYLDRMITRAAQVEPRTRTETRARDPS